MLKQGADVKSGTELTKGSTIHLRPGGEGFSTSKLLAVDMGCLQNGLPARHNRKVGFSTPFLSLVFHPLPYPHAQLTEFNFPDAVGMGFIIIETPLDTFPVVGDENSLRHRQDLWRELIFVEFATLQ